MTNLPDVPQLPQRDLRAEKAGGVYAAFVIYCVNCTRDGMMIEGEVPITKGQFLRECRLKGWKEVRKDIKKGGKVQRVRKWYCPQCVIEAMGMIESGKGAGLLE